MNSKKERAYVAGGVGCVVAILLLIISYDLGWSLYGQLVGGVGVVFMVLSILSFWKPERFGLFVSKIFLGK
jgi:hypothetical protein